MAEAYSIAPTDLGALRRTTAVTVFPQQGVEYTFIQSSWGVVFPLSDPCRVNSETSWWTMSLVLAVGEAVPTVFAGRSLAGELGGTANIGDILCTHSTFDVYELRDPWPDLQGMAWVTPSTGAIDCYIGITWDLPNPPDFVPLDTVFLT